MKRIVMVLAIMMLFVASSLASQNSPESVPKSDGSILGKVIDSESGAVIEYANVAIYSVEDSSLITGGITDATGFFNVQSISVGQYYATIQFIGYQMRVVEGITLTKQGDSENLGTISLVIDAQNIDELDVVVDKQQVLFKIDKKVVNPSQLLAAQGGTATDVLANTPSISVDVDGNVSMRGSRNFTVLINDKPTPFEASDALAQIPASSIENIEIITNPSARFDPDGAAGIINVITKKKPPKGWNGIVNANVNTLGSYGGNFLINTACDKAQWYLGGNRTDRLSSADYSNASGTIDTDFNSLSLGDTLHVLQEGHREMSYYANTLKAGVDYNLNDNNTVGLEFQLGQNGRGFVSDLDNKEWSTGESKLTSTSMSQMKGDGDYGSFSISQSSTFGDDKKHKLESSFFYQEYQGQDDTYSVKETDNGVIISSQETWQMDNSNEYRFRTDYSHPWKKGDVEGGYQLRIDDSWSYFDAKFDNETDDKYYNEYSFYRMINSAYATFSGESGLFGYKFGLRAEHTLRQLEDFSSVNNEIDRLDWYPSLHFSYNVSEKQSLMANFTKRIDRPRSYRLDPYVMWRDPNNVRVGNVELQPQYIDSYELSYQLRFGRNFISAELFHRHVEDKVESVRSKYQDGVIMTTFDNVGEDYSTGLELMVNYNITPWWCTSISGSLYDYRINVSPEYSSSVNEVQSNHWQGRWSNTFKPTSTLRIQFNTRYKSDVITATGTNCGYAFSSLAVKKSFFKRKLDFGVSLIDVFDTSKMDMNASGDSFYSNFYFDMASPFFQFNLTYIFNNYKPDGKKREKGTSVQGDF